MLAVAIPVTIINPRMVSAANLTAVSMDAALLIVAALAQMLVLITRNIDLSIAAVIGLSAYMAASMVQAYPGLDIVVGLATACAVGGVAGLLNGLVVTRGRVPAIVVTLASHVDLSRLQLDLGGRRPDQRRRGPARPGST